MLRKRNKKANVGAAHNPLAIVVFAGKDAGAPGMLVVVFGFPG
jgi:hypothetical protein